MELLLAIVAGVLYATGLYLMLRRRLGAIDHRPRAAVERIEHPDLRRGRRDTRQAAAHRPIVSVRADQFADPVPQSLILTAIVIGFGVLAFALVLAHRVHASAGSDDIDAIDRIGADAARASDPAAAGHSDRAAPAAAAHRVCCAAWRSSARVLILGRRRVHARPRAVRRHPGPPGRALAGAVRHHPGRRPVQRRHGGDGRHHRRWR